jgi:dTDP-4-amino-4,6-dideoxygalactose transaminase
MTSGEGGMLVARSPEVRARARSLRSHGMTAPSWDRRSGRASSYDVPGLGFNYRPTDLTSAIGRAQLAKLQAEQARRRDLTAEYHRRLRAAGVPVTLPFARSSAPSAHHLMPVLLPAGVDRAAVQAALRDAGVQSSVHYPPVHRFSAYRGMTGGSLAVTEAVADRLLSLPLHGRLTTTDVDLVVTTLGAALHSRSESPSRPPQPPTRAPEVGTVETPPGSVARADEVGAIERPPGSAARAGQGAAPEMPPGPPQSGVAGTAARAGEVGGRGG